MRILIYSDLQAEDGAERHRHHPSTPLQRWRVEKFYAWAAELARTKNIHAVWDLGDTTHNRTALSHPTIQTVTRGCAQLTRGLNSLLNFKLLGNHEQHLKETSSHVGNLFTPYFHVVEDFEIFTLPGEKLRIICASFSPDWAQLGDRIRSALVAESNHRALLLGHFSVAGAKLSSGPIAHGIPREILNAADLVLLGHIHRRQKIGDHIHYVGSPFQQDFGEAGDPVKCVAILDTATLALEWVPTPFPVHRTISVLDLAEATAGQDILRVAIRSPEEAQQLYASPHSARVEPVYDFAPERGTETAFAGSLDFENLVEAYAAQVSLPGCSAGELVAEARALC